MTLQVNHEKKMEDLKRSLTRLNEALIILESYIFTLEGFVEPSLTNIVKSGTMALELQQIQPTENTHRL